MEAQIARGPGHVEDAPEVGVEQSNDQGTEKKSILRKVKDKAKKLKKNFSPSRHQDKDQEEDDGDDDDEELIDNQSPPPLNPPFASSDDPTVTQNKPREDFNHRSLADVLGGSNTGADPSHHQSKVADPTYDEPKPREFDPSVIDNKPRDNFPDTSLRDAVHGSSLEEDPEAPKGEFEKADPGNYQSKVADPTSDNRTEAHIGPLADQLGALKVEEKSPTGSHDQFLPDSENTPYNVDEDEAKPAPDSYTGKISAATSAIAGSAVAGKDAIADKLGYGNKEGTDHSPETVDTESRDFLPASDDVRDVDVPAPESENRPPASYTEKLSAATAAITGSAFSAKDAIADRLGYGKKAEDQSLPADTTTEDKDQFLPASDYNDGESKLESVPGNPPPASYSDKLSAASSAVAGSAVSAKDSIANKLGYGKKVGDESLPDDTTTEDKDQFLPASDHVSYNDRETDVNPATENPPPASYSEKISAATSAITGSAVSAKDAIAGKLGYGTNTEGEQAVDAPPTAPVGTRVRETLAPVYDKVAGAGTAVASKLPGTGTTEDGSTVNSPSNLSERLRPGDEDRALSEVISGALSRKKDVDQVDGSGSPAGERSLAADGGGSPGSGNVVGRIKGAVTSLFSKGSESPGQVASPKGEGVEGTTLHETPTN